MNDDHTGDLRILCLVGSLRRDSVNRRLMDVAREVLGSRCVADSFERLKQIPPFDEDDEVTVGHAVRDLRARIAGANAVLVATPEYNGSVPGQLKNAIDWASRPRATSVLRGKSVAVIGASPGPGGARGAIADAQRILERAGAVVVDETISVSRVHDRFDDDGTLSDSWVRDGVENVAAALMAHRSV